MPAPLLLPALAGAASELINSVINMFDGDKKRQAEVVIEQLKIASAESTAQAETNKAEAMHASVFVAGWRPGIGWVCCISLASYYLPKHILAAIFYSIACWKSQAILPYPIDASGLMELIYGMLGLGVLRSFDKKSGAAR